MHRIGAYSFYHNYCNTVLGKTQEENLEYLHGYGDGFLSPAALSCLNTAGLR